MRKTRRKESDLRAIRDIAVQFLYLEVIPTSIPFVVQHPFFSSSSCYLPQEKKWVDIMDDEEGLFCVREKMEKLIQKSDCDKIIFLIQKPYRLTFLKYIKNSLSKPDFSHFLAKTYLYTEFPSSDVNVPVSTLKRWFQAADKQHLMSEGEKAHFFALPNKVTVYRGITDLKGVNGLSWTEDQRIALKFANRFRTKEAYVLTAEIDRDEIIAYFDRANEKEIICQPKEYTVQKI